MSPSRTAMRRSDLVDQRDALLRSLEDLDRERTAGDLDQDAYDDLRATYIARAAEVLRSLEEIDAASLDGDRGVEGSATTTWQRFRRVLGRRPVRIGLTIGATICVVGAVTLAALTLAGVRLPGQGETGGVVIPKSTEVNQDLRQASALASGGDIAQAVELYDAVLKVAPNQPEALTYKGWLERLSGHKEHASALVELGDAALHQAVTVAPTYADAIGLYGIALLQDGGPKARQEALDAFRTFCLTPGNDAVLAAQGPTMAAAFVAANEKVPTQLERYVGSKGTPAAST